MGGNALTSYAPVPFYLTNHLHALFLENSEYSVFDLRQPEQVQVQTWHNTMTGRVIYAESPAEIISEYTTYSGRMRPLPNWVTSGAIVGMQGGTDKVRTVWGQLKEHNTPLAAFWLQDWVGQRTTTFYRVSHKIPSRHIAVFTSKPKPNTKLMKTAGLFYHVSKIIDYFIFYLVRHWFLW